MINLSREAEKITRTSLMVAYASIAAAIFAEHFELFAHVNEMIVGAALMCATVLFYAELSWGLVTRKSRLFMLIFVATLKFGLLILVLCSPFMQHRASLIWLMVGFLLLIPVAAIVAALPEQQEPEQQAPHLA